MIFHQVRESSSDTGSYDTSSVADEFNQEMELIFGPIMDGESATGKVELPELLRPRTHANTPKNPTRVAEYNQPVSSADSMRMIDTLVAEQRNARLSADDEIATSPLESRAAQQRHSTPSSDGLSAEAAAAPAIQHHVHVHLGGLTPKAMQVLTQQGLHIHLHVHGQKE